jgi:hypothetical protein
MAIVIVDLKKATVFLGCFFYKMVDMPVPRGFYKGRVVSVSCI